MNADDFTALVSKANPAASRGQYGQVQPNSSISYPPTTNRPNNPYELDPFFDDDDDGASSVPTRASPAHRGNNVLMDSSPDLPLTKNAVLPAGAPGAGASGVSLPKPWTFDDDAPGLPPPNTAPFKPPPPKAPQPKRKLKWPWTKDVDLTGERDVWLNDASRNDTGGYSSNYVSTGKYNVATFVPKFLLGEYLRPWSSNPFDQSCELDRTILKIRELVLPFYW